MSVQEIGIFGRKEYPFFSLPGSSFLLDDVLDGRAHQAGTSRHQHSHRRGVLALVAHLVWPAQVHNGAQDKHVDVLIFAVDSEVVVHSGAGRANLTAG